MGMVIKDLFKISLFKEAKLEAGGAGLDNEIIWFNLMEILDVVSSLEKGEFLITTGFGLDKEKFSKNLVYKLKERGVAGLGIQLGYYIEEIPKHILEQAEEVGFPIINIPGKITFSMITRTMFKELLTYGQKDEEFSVKNETNSVVLDILENKCLTAKGKDCLFSILGDHNERETFIANFSIGHKHDGIIMRSDIEKSVDKINKVLKSYNCIIHNEVIKGSSIIVFSKLKSVNFMSIFNGLEKEVNQLSSMYNNLIFTIGISSVVLSIEDVRKGYFEALAAESHIRKIGALRGVVEFQDIELLDLFSNEAAKNSMIDFAKQILAPIMEYDLDNEGCYLETLKTYILNNYNITSTAKQLYIHRHTLSYRLERISELFKVDFSNHQSMMKYMLALYINSLYI